MNKPTTTNTLREVSNLPAPLCELRKMQLSRDQYKQDYEDQLFTNHLIEADLRNMVKRYTRYGQQAQCVTVQLMCSLIVTDLQQAINNKSFNLNNLIA